MLKNFRTYQLAVELYKMCQTLQLKGEMRNQLDRASLSVALNLAEGSAKPTAKDRAKFYRIALGSLREVQAIINILNHEHLAQKSDILGAHLYRLCKNCI